MCLWLLPPEGDGFISCSGKKDIHLLVLNSPSTLVPWGIPLALEEMRVGCDSVFSCSIQGIPEQVGIERWAGKNPH